MQGDEPESVSAIIAPAVSDVATVRQRLAEQDTEIQRLREERDEADGVRAIWQDSSGAYWERMVAAEAEVRRLTEGLREIENASVAQGYERYEEDVVGAWVVDKARALLAASPGEARGPRGDGQRLDPWDGHLDVARRDKCPTPGCDAPADARWLEHRHGCMRYMDGKTDHP